MLRSQLLLFGLDTCGVSCTARGLWALLPTSVETAGIGIPEHPWFAKYIFCGRRLHVRPAEAFYRQGMAHILEDGDLPALPDAQGLFAHTYMRLRMHARWTGEVLDEKTMHALWLCMGTVEKNIDGRVRTFRLRAAAKAALELGREIQPWARQTYYAERGLAAGCMARLLYAGQSMIKEK